MPLLDPPPVFELDQPQEQLCDRIELPVEPDEGWWGGAIVDGSHMPFGAAPFGRDLAGSHTAHPSNQAAPLLISTRGRIVWSQRPFRFEFGDGTLRAEGKDIVVRRAGSTLREAYLSASGSYFPASGRHPDARLFAGPQYNTWIEHPYGPTQDDVLSFVRGLLDAGMPPGVVIIDDSWSPDYGVWTFDRSRFADPARMVTQLHEWGCSVMLWIVPFVSPDSAAFRDLESRRLVIRDRTGDTAIRRWWNGLSALLDLTNPQAVSWLTDQLDELVTVVGIDGFKFDAGDSRDYRADDLLYEPAEPVDLCEAWSRVGLRYAFNEFRASWRMGGQALGQRLQDKPPHWGPTGIESLIPEMLAQSMIGHAFTCPDMIGGGEISAMGGAGGIDQEFFVRYAQVAALSPMMQFSVSPARVLDARHLCAVREALRIREEFTPLILELVTAAARTGEPIVRPMAYHCPELQHVTDQFYLGPDVIVAPVLTQGATTRAIVLPEGTWRSDAGETITGPAAISTVADLDRLPRFVRTQQ